MSKLTLSPSEGLYPSPIVLVTCIDKTAKIANIITIAWCGVICSKPPLVSISVRPSRHSHKLIKETRDFVINIPSRDLLIQTDRCGMISGSDIDKFELCSFTKVPSSKVSSPMIRQCPVNIECELRDTKRLGSHDMFIGEVVCIHADEEITDTAGRIDFGKAKPFVYNLGEYWAISEKIGWYGCSGK